MVDDDAPEELSASEENASEEIVSASDEIHVVVDEEHRRIVDRPFIWGFVASLGILATIALALAIFNLSGLVFSIFMAAFITVGFNPLVQWIQRKGVKRPIAILIVILAIIVIVVGLIWLVLPILIDQFNGLIEAIPKELERLKAEGWYDVTDGVTNGALDAVLTWVAGLLQDPAFWAALGGGLLALGLGVASGLSTLFFTFILTIYFMGTYDAMKNAAYRLVRRSHRASFVGYSERILENVGRYLSGMVILAFMNATYSTILLLITGVPAALFIGVIAFFITIIPLIGTVLTTIAMSVIAFIYDPTAGIIVLIFMLIYMQVEAYVFTPRVMSKAVKIPGSVVLISALAGGTLAGLPGALIAIPLSAGLLLIITGVVMPKKEIT